jgi:ABC-type sulfate/molybdate transport systems ATPase subunit
LADRTTTVVLVSHRPEEVLGLADRVAVLVGGDLRQAAPGDELVSSPADAAVARLVGYENVVDVEVDDGGKVLLAGRPTGLTAHPGRRPATLAVWAAAIAVRERERAPLRAVVEHVSTGPGRHELTLDAGVPLRAHLPLGAPPPPPGSEVSLDLDTTQAAVLESDR